MSLASEAQKPISLKVPEKMLLAIEDCIKKGHFDSRSEFFREAIRELVNEELHSQKWEMFSQKDNNSR